MSLRRTQPLAFRPRGLSDALESSQVFSGAMTALQDLIPDPSTKGLWQCRPAAIELGAFGGIGAFSTGFSSGFAVVTGGAGLPAPLGSISCMLVVGDIVYGMIGAAVNQDYPFAFNLVTNAFLSVTGFTTSNIPTTQPSSGDWIPPTMDIIGSTVMVTHPGFAGTSNWIGWFDVTNPAAPVWHAGNITGAGGFTFSATTGVPVAVKAFNGRAYWAFNPPSGPSATVFSDVLAPLVVTNAGSVQIITYDDNVHITALGALPLSNQLGGIIQSLMVFKGVSNIYQITGDIALGPGPPLGTLARNTLNVATGTFSPNSLASTPKGLAFVAPDGMRIIDFNAAVSDPIGTDGNGKTLPFIYAVAPSRIAAAANGTVYRVSVQDGSRTNSPQSEYWLDFSRGAIWSGPHSLPARVIKPYKQTFITAPISIPATLFKSDYLQSPTSTFTENGVPMKFTWLSTLLPDTDQMCENAMVESTLYIGMAGGASYDVKALDESDNVLGEVSLVSVINPVLWGQFTWGQAQWGGAATPLFPQSLAWPAPVVFRRLAMSVTGPADQALRLGSLHLRYEMLGYLHQPQQFTQGIETLPPPFTPLPTPSGPISSAGIFAGSGVSTRSGSLALGPLVRTLWSAQTNDIRLTADPKTLWDGTLDDGTVAPTGDYTLMVLTHDVHMNWDGVVGNTSPDHTNTSLVPAADGVGNQYTWYHSYGGLINDMAINPSGEIYFSTGYDERMHTYHMTTTANLQYSNSITTQGFRESFVSTLGCCSDGIIVYWHNFYQPGNSDFIWGINCTTKLRASFSGDTTTGDNSGMGSAVGRFILGIAVQQAGNQLFASRLVSPGPPNPSYGVQVFNKTTGALLQDILLPYAAQGGCCIDPTNDSLWLINTSASATANATFDPIFKSSSNVIISNSNLTAAVVVAPGGGNSDHAYSTGATSAKVYFEIVQNSTGSVAGNPFGISSSRGLTGFLGFSPNDAGFYGNGSYNVQGTGTSGTPVFNPGDNVGIAVDIANHNIWMRVNGGLWNNSSTADPATGTGALSTGTIAGPIYAAVGFDLAVPSQCTAQFASSSWTYAAPAGFGQLPGVNYSFNVSQYTSDATTGVLTATGKQVTGLAGAVSCAISPDGSTLLVVDAGTSQQVKAFNTSDGSVKTAWGNSGTLGTLGGYTNSPAVTNTKFMFGQSFIGFTGCNGFVRYVPADGSFWIGDGGNARNLHFSAGNSPTFIEQIQYMPGFYASWVCFNDPTRVFINCLEFKIDYTKTLAPGNGSWTLVNNWFPGSGNPDGFGAMRHTITGSNGRTYVPVPPLGAIHELTTTGRRVTGINANFDYLDRQFNLWHIAGADPGGQASYFVNHFTGFDGSGNPTWANDPTVAPSNLVLMSAVFPATFPEATVGNDTGNYVEALANNIIPIYDSRTGSFVNHLGGIDATTGAIRFNAHPSTPSNNSNIGGALSYLLYPPNPVFPASPAGTGATGARDGFIAYMPGDTNFFTICRAEAWGQNQVCFWSHWDQSGLLINRKGVAAPYFGAYLGGASSAYSPFLTKANRDTYGGTGSTNGAPQPRDSVYYGAMGTLGLAGNASWGGIAQIGSDYYLYNNDEWYHGGLHRWHISNTSSIQTATVPISWKSTDFKPPTKIPYNFLSGLPYNTLNLPNNTAGWVRNPPTDNLSGGGLRTPPYYRVYTSAIVCDLHLPPDLVLDCNLAGPATVTLSYNWTRTGSGPWTIAGSFYMPNRGLVNFVGGVETADTLIYIDILDAAGKILVRMFNGNISVFSGAGPPEGATFWVNYQPIHTPYHDSDSIWQNYIQDNLPLTVHYDGHAVTVTYGDYTISGITSYETGGDLTKPAQFRLTYFETAGQQAYMGISVTSMVFSDN